MSHRLSREELAAWLDRRPDAPGTWRGIESGHFRPVAAPDGTFGFIADPSRPQQPIVQQEPTSSILEASGNDAHSIAGALAAACKAEREACAKVADGFDRWPSGAAIAAAIRSRTETEHGGSPQQPVDAAPAAIPTAERGEVSLAPTSGLKVNFGNEVMPVEWAPNKPVMRVHSSLAQGEACGCCPAGFHEKGEVR